MQQITKLVYYTDAALISFINILNIRLVVVEIFINLGIQAKGCSVEYSVTLSSNA